MGDSITDYLGRRSCKMCSSCQERFPIPTRRELRKRMKHSTMRKITSVQRIEINRFWNELEDIFEKLEEKKVDDKYSTIEEAENIMNETVECDNEVEAVLDNYSEEGYCSGPEEEEEDREDFLSFQSQEDFLNYQHQKPLPLPPSFKQTRNILRLFCNNNDLSYL